METSLNMLTIHSASMDKAMRTGDMSLLVPLKENKNNADVQAEYARIRNEYGEQEANTL